MADSIPQKSKTVAITVDAWSKARKMAGLRTIRGQKDADLGAVTSEAICEEYNKLPPEIREMLEQAETPEAA